MCPEGYNYGVGQINNRFQTPTVGAPDVREYDLNPEDIYDSISRGVAPFSVYSFPLTNAGTMPIAMPGRAFVAYGYTTATALTTKTVLNSFRLDVGVNVSDLSDTSRIFPARHCRGYNGTFNKLYLSWSAQATASVDFVVLRSIRDPWMQDQST